MPRGTCWEGYVQKGFKKKGNRSVPNCVPVQKSKKGKMIKKYQTGHEVQGPKKKEDGFALEPQIRSGSSFDQNTEKKTKGASLYLHSPYGRVGVHYDKDVDKFTDDSELNTTRKGASYDIQKEIGPGTLTASTSIGESKNQFRKGKTKQGMLSYTVPLEFGKKTGGIIKGKPKIALRGWK